MKLVILITLLAAFGVCQSDDCDTLDKCQDAIKTNGNNSLARFRLGEIYFIQGHYQPAANELRQALDGNLQPRWVEAWALVDLGKIFDITHQRQRALNYDRRALRTNDNTRGALDAANKYIETPYSPN
jgi:tetratricopeptide (TPR) repeat protein